jgi:hypothetical protein
VPRRGGWRAWGAVRANFERALARASDPAIASAEIASELRRGADYVRVTVAFTVVTTDVAGALTIGWDTFRSAARMTRLCGAGTVLGFGVAVQGIIFGYMLHCSPVRLNAVRPGIRLLGVSRRKSRGCRASAARRRKEPSMAGGWVI